MKTFYFSAFFFSFFTILYAAGPGKSGCLERERALALLEAAEEILSKARDIYPSCKEDLNSTGQSECSSKKPLAYIEISKKLISDVRENFPTCIGSNVVDPNVKYRDCAEILANGHNESGFYMIRPNKSDTTGKPLQVYCDMETDGGGWTVIQRRGKFPVQQDFNQNWETYENGFGKITEEFWLGNKNIRAFCHKGCEIRFDLQDKDGIKGYAVYKTFKCFGSKYSIYISDYAGDIGDAMYHHNNYYFSTRVSGIAEEMQGGWWHRTVTNECNLNGVYQPEKSGENNVFWHPWKGFDNLASVEIKVKQK